MAANDVSFRQSAVIEFLVKEEIPAADIHRRLHRVYGDVCLCASSVRWWVKHFKDEDTSIQDQPRSGRPHKASAEPNRKRFDEITKEDKRVILDASATKLGIGHNAVQETIWSLGYRKICVRWILCLMTEDHKVWPWKKLRTWGGMFSLTLRTVLIWHPPITLSLVLWRIWCEANITRRTRHSRELCVVFGQLERSSAAREYSNFRNSGKNVYRETGIMLENKQMSMD